MTVWGVLKTYNSNDEIKYIVMPYSFNIGTVKVWGFGMCFTEKQAIKRANKLNERINKCANVKKV